MKRTIHQVVSMAMALLLLLSTTSWKVEKHYCMGRLMDVALFLDVDDCGMEMPPMENDGFVVEQGNSCCDDEVIFMAGQDNLNISFEDLDSEQQTFLIAFAYTFQRLFEFENTQFVPHEHYPPPQLVKDIQLLDQVFLI